MNRRSVTQGLTAALLSNLAPGCAQRRNVRAFYACEMDIEVDGRAYTLKNGGELSIWEGSYPGNSATTHNWYPFAATMQLPSGEVLAAIPPSPEGGIKAAFRDATRTPDGGFRDGTYVLPDAFRAYLDAAYPQTAVPLVYIFDRGTDTRYAEGYAMRAALLDGDTRVTARGLRIKRVSKDVRTSAAALFPWLKPVEEIAPMLASKAPGQYTSGVSEVLRNDNTVVGAPELAGYTVLLEGAFGNKPFSEAGNKFRSLNSVLAAKQIATVWLHLERQAANGRVFSCNYDPRIAIFRREWAGRRESRLLLAAGDELSIGGAAFAPDTEGFVTAKDKATKMLTGSHNFLGNLLEGRGRGGDRANWHSALSPQTAGFAGTLGEKQ